MAEKIIFDFDFGGNTEETTEELNSLKEELDEANSKLNESKLREDSLNYCLQYIKERKQNITYDISQVTFSLEKELV